MKRYYTLFGQPALGLPFEIVFGDYNLETVKEEQTALLEDYESFYIVETSDEQSEIDAKLKQLNTIGESK